VWGGDCAADGTITLLPGDVKECTITNDDVKPKLTLRKTVTNDDGGSLTQADFPSFVDGSPVAWDTQVEVTANVQHTASETPQTGYTPSVWGGDCAADGTITLLPGDVKECTITNDDALLTVVKDVINDDGRTAQPNDFLLTVSGPFLPSSVVLSGVANAFPANTGLAVNETLLTGYQFVSIGQGLGDSSKCPAVLGGTITLDPGESAVCTLVNDDLPPVGAGTQGYWKRHPEAWPVESITIGGVTYTKAEAIEIMKKLRFRDKTYTMFQQLAAAKLNVLIGADSSCIATTILDADTWMSTFGPVGSLVRARSDAWSGSGNGLPLKSTLDDYNNGRLCAPHRGSLL
jgi:hypothetical protein